MTLLRAGHADVVLVGGAEAWSRAIYAGFYSLGVMGARASSPFSRQTGVTFGEGAGCIVIERPDHARGRSARLHGMVRGYGTSSDAHHITAPNPGGQGLARAMLLALQDAGLPATAIGYINAHGTGTPDNDVAETLAVHRVFAGHEPPVSSSKSFFGHTLGAAGVLEFISSLIGMKEGFLPPTLNFEEARPGCDLDYVPNQARAANYDAFFSISAAFGGVNVVAVGARAEAGEPTDAAPEQPSQSIVVTGLGIVSPIGCGSEAFRAALREGKSGIRPITRFDTSGLRCRNAALIDDLPARKLAPAADTRRMDAITRFAVVATTLALKDAGIAGKVAPERIGLFVAMSAGPVTSAQIYAEELHRSGIAALSAKYFPPIVLSILGGQIGLACQIRGANFTLIDGVGAGLQALAHARDMLAQHDELDAIVVVACDEVGPGFHRMLDMLGALAPDGTAAIYDPNGPGFVPGEGSVAMVIEKADRVAARGGRTYGRIAGVAFGSEGGDDEAVDPDGAVLSDVARRALAGGEPPDLIYTLARGAGAHDRREAAALRALLGEHRVPVSSLNGQLGLADATSGLYAAAAALLGLRHGEAYPTHAATPTVEGIDVVRGGVRNGEYGRALALGSSEHGNSTAVIFTHGR
jgi:3-oxoacyl-[acyl-carrier-protein] synthase II